MVLNFSHGLRVQALWNSAEVSRERAELQDSGLSHVRAKPLYTLPTASLVRCFAGQDVAAGSLARVFLLSDPAIMASVAAFETAAAMLARDMALGNDTLAPVGVFAGQLQRRSEQAAASDWRIASFSAAGRRIQFCGHGALAAAFVLFDQCVVTGTLHCESQSQQWLARRNSPAAGAGVTLVYPRPEAVTCPIPEFAFAVIGSVPQAAAIVGDAEGYLILELADYASVQQLSPDFEQLVRATRRALIVTAAAEYAGASGCVFRYFAPQYGNPEDSATGSAAVQLGAYWSPRLGVTQFIARQLSATGAWLQIGCVGNTAELGGQVGYG